MLLHMLAKFIGLSETCCHIVSVRGMVVDDLERTRIAKS